MAYQCDICGKSKQYGHNVSFSQRKTNRVWKPNLQTKSLEINGNKTKLRLCTQCLRSIQKTAQAQTAKTEAV